MADGANLILVMPAQTRVLGGVQRFADSVARELTDLTTVHEISLHPAHPRDNRYARVAEHALRLSMFRRTALRREHMGVLSTYHWPPSMSRHTPTVGYIHDLRSLQEVRYASPKLRLFAEVWSRWRYAAVPSEHVRAAVAAVAPRARVEVVHEGLDHLAVPQAEVSVDRRIITVLGGRAPHKRAGLGLEAALSLQPALGVDVHFIGDMPDVGRPTPRVTSHPAPTDDELASLLQQSIFSIAPTSYEGFGLAVGEAMWFGAPILYAADAPLSWLVQDGGIACDPSVESFLAGGLRLAEDHAQRGAAAAARAGEFRWASTANRLLDLFG